MIPRSEDVVAGYPFVARRFQLGPEHDEGAIRAAIEHARRLAESRSEEPAAMFYAFAIRLRAFPRAWRLMAGILAANQARATGHTLRATKGELDAMCSDVIFKRADFDAVRSWFAARLTRSR